MVVTGRDVSARSVWVTLGVVFVLGAVLIAWVLSGGRPVPTRPGSLMGFDSESTATAGFAGMIPSAEEPALPRPLGLDGDGRRLYVCLSDSSSIGVFTYDGAFEQTITLKPAEGAATVTPVDVALLPDGTLAVVDTAGGRVVIVDPEDPVARGREFSGGTGAGRIVEPTAIEVAGESVFVADASDGSVREYSSDGRIVRMLRFEPPLPSFVGGMCAAEGTLWVADSNADRVVAVDLGRGVQRLVVPQRFGLPRGIAVTGSGEVMVAETFGKVVSVLGPDGASVITEFPGTGTENLDAGGRLEAPESLLWDETGARLYVTDALSGRIKVYNYRRSGS